MQPEASAYLWDARNAADRIASFIDGVSSDSYANDELRRSAVERQLEIIGEALNNLRKKDPDTAAQIPDLQRIIGLRNVLVHGYAVIDDQVVWLAASDRVPQLRRAIDTMLSTPGAD